MLNADQLVDRQYHEMRWRILSLAADFDRLQRAGANDKRPPVWEAVDDAAVEKTCMPS